LSVESAQIDCLLKVIADLVIHDDAGGPLNGFLDCFRTGLANIVGCDDGDFGGNGSRVSCLTGESSAGDDDISDF
jgi:hypothetical protein